MAWKEYEYKQQWSDRFGSESRPMMQVKFSNDGNEFSPLSLVDSGSSATMINDEIAGILKINLNPCQEISIGGVGSAKGKLCSVVFEIPEFKIKKTIEAVFVKDLPFSVLLGQNDFFSELDVKFEQTKGSFYLRKPTK